MVILENSRALPKEPAEQSQDSSDGLSVPSTQSLRHDIRKRIGRADQSTDRGTSSTPVSADDRSETVVKLQEAFEQGVPRDSSPEQKSRYAESLKTSKELLAQYQQVSQKIVALGPNADPNTLQDLHSRADLLIKRSAATLFHANTEQTIAGIEQRQEHVTQLAERLTKEIKELEKLDESAPQRVAGLLELKKDQLQAFEDTGSALETIRLSLSDSLTKSDSFLKRAEELENGEPVVSGQLAEANANMDSALLVLEDADGKTSLQAINTGLQHLEEAQLLEVERREQFAQSIANYDTQEQRLREACKTSLNRAQTGVNEAGIATEGIKQVTSSLIPFKSFISLVTGTTSAMEASRDNILSTAAEQNVTSGQLLDDLKNVKRAREEYIKWTHAGFEAERQGDIQKAQARFNQAALINDATADLGNPERILQTLTQPSINWRQRNREVTRKLHAAIASADKWEAGLEVARTVTVAAGATVATVATAGAGAGIFLSFVAGSGGGIAIGSASNFTEQGIGVATELKTAEQAKADFGRRFTQDAFTSVQAAGSTVTGLGAGRLFQSSSIASKLSPLGTRTLSGTIGGGASGATTTTIDIAQTLYRRNEAIADFNKSPEAQALSTEDRQAALDAHLSQQGLGLDDLAKRGIVNIGVSFVGGAVGANTGAVREAAKTNLGKISTVVLDTGGDLTLGLGATLLTDGDISFEQGLAQSLQSVFVGNALSSLPARQIGVAEASAQPAKTKVNYLADAQSLRERFVSDSIDQLTATNGRSPTPDEVARITAESQSVRAYENPNTGEINVIKLNIESMDRFERVRYASDIVHELAHRRGGDEVIAHKAQFEYLLKNGYQPELRDGQLKIRALEADESGTLPTDEQISDYVSRNYDAEESVGGMRLAKVEETSGPDTGTALTHGDTTASPLSTQADLEERLFTVMKKDAWRSVLRANPEQRSSLLQVYVDLTDPRNQAASQMREQAGLDVKSLLDEITPFFRDNAFTVHHDPRFERRGPKDMMTDFQRNPEEYLVQYHGTDSESARSILKNGIDPSRGGEFGPGFYTTSSNHQARRWALEKAKDENSAVVVRVIIPKSELKAVYDQGRYLSFPTAPEAYKNDPELANLFENFDEANRKMPRSEQNPVEEIDLVAGPLIVMLRERDRNVTAPSTMDQTRIADTKLGRNLLESSHVDVIQVAPRSRRGNN